jgi:hypothetical protein
MEIKRVLNLTQEEFDALIKAGEILGAANKVLEANEADELSDGLKNLISALKNVSEKLVK